jgi:putative endonuclease
MEKDNLKLGSIGERIASNYLEEKGYKIIERNYENKYGEIDLICKDRDCLVFVEVKTRRGEQFGLPENAVDYKKIRRIARNAQAYIIRKNKSCYNVNYRIDAVCIILDINNKINRISHYENINN